MKRGLIGRILLPMMVTLLFLSGCNDINQKSISDIKVYEEEKFTQSNAIDRVLKEHPEFPSSPGVVKTLEVPVGGPCCDNKVKAELTTKIEKLGEESYLVTLTKDWNFTYGNNYVLSYWKYEVNNDTLTLTDSVNEDDFHLGIK
ncbi:hypothetical protein J2S09_005057 [Bacillus fengqiuensis]|nr:hypothetical protein [Bacillus fengqiuensis]